MIKTSIFGLAVLAMGVVLTMSMLREQAAEKRLRDEGVTTEAKVTGGGMTHPKRGGTTYYIDLAYMVAGQEYEKLRITVPEVVYHQYWKGPGGEVTAVPVVIRYLPEEPQRMMMVEPKVEVGTIAYSKWTWVVIAVTLGYGGYAVGAAILNRRG